MLRTTVAVLLTAVVVLFGARALFHPAGGIPSGSQPSQDCRKQDDCKVPIAFNCLATNLAPTCTPVPSAQVLLVRPGNKIHFTFDSTTGHTFNHSDGIKFVSGNDGGKLPCVPDTSDPKMQAYTCTDTLQAGTVDAYKYQIDVDWMFTVDPWAVNY